jgi:hypothetical protein
VRTFITTFLAALAASFIVMRVSGASKETSSVGRTRMKLQDDESLDYYPWLAREMRREENGGE